jgi:hypothetical protein
MPAFSFAARIRLSADIYIPQQSQEDSMDATRTRRLGARFKLGQVLVTPTALEAIETSQQSVLGLLVRHVRGDWNEMPDMERMQNERAIDANLRVISKFKVLDTRRLLIITDSDRSLTTILLLDDIG